MKALILAAGYGTRLYPLIKDTAKALLFINDRPIIDYALDKLKNLGNLGEVIVVTNEKFYSDFKEWSQGHKDFPCPVRTVNDNTKTPEDRLGSIGDIDFVLKEKSFEEDLLVMGGDNLFDFRIEEFVSAAKVNAPKVTVGLYDIKERNKAKIFGVVELDGKERIVSFEEKPQVPKSSLIATCLYYLPTESLVFIGQYLKEVKKSDTAGGYIRWLCQCQDVYGSKFDGKWYDIGSIESYNNAQNNFRTLEQKGG